MLKIPIAAESLKNIAIISGGGGLRSKTLASFIGKYEIRSQKRLLQAVAT